MTDPLADLLSQCPWLTKGKRVDTLLGPMLAEWLRSPEGIAALRADKQIFSAMWCEVAKVLGNTTTIPSDFFEEDEPIEDVKAAFDRGDKGTTGHG